MANRDTKKKPSDHAPPRTTNEARFANFLRQTGLQSAGSAKARRAKAGSKKGRRG